MPYRPRPTVPRISRLTLRQQRLLLWLLGVASFAMFSAFWACVGERLQP